MRESRLLGPMLVALAVGTASTGACGGIVEVAGDSGTGSSSGGSSGSGSGVVSSSGVSSSGTDVDSGFGSSSGVFDASGDSTFGDTGVADVTASCTESIPIYGLDGGMNTACEACLAASCSQEQCACIDDPNMTVGDDAGTMYPACDVYVICVYPDAIQILLSTDAGVLSAFMTAMSDYSSSGAFPSSSESLGNTFITCMGTSCFSECVP